MPQEEIDDTLVLILKESLEMHKQLLDLLKAERDVLVKNSGALPSVTSKKQDLLGRLEEKDKERRLALVNVAAEYNIKLKEATLARLAQVSGNSQYESLRQGFEGVLTQIKECQVRNNALIQQGLSVANEIIDVLCAQQEGPLYGPGGATEESKSSNKYVDGHI